MLLKIILFDDPLQLTVLGYVDHIEALIANPSQTFNLNALTAWRILNTEISELIKEMTPPHLIKEQKAQDEIKKIIKDPFLRQRYDSLKPQIKYLEVLQKLVDLEELLVRGDVERVRIAWNQDKNEYKTLCQRCVPQTELLKYSMHEEQYANFFVDHTAMDVCVFKRWVKAETIQEELKGKNVPKGLVTVLLQGVQEIPFDLEQIYIRCAGYFEGITKFLKQKGAHLPIQRVLCSGEAFGTYFEPKKTILSSEESIESEKERNATLNKLEDLIKDRLQELEEDMTRAGAEIKEHKKNLETASDKEKLKLQENIDQSRAFEANQFVLSDFYTSDIQGKLLQKIREKMIAEKISAIKAFLSVVNPYVEGKYGKLRHSEDRTMRGIPFIMEDEIDHMIDRYKNNTPVQQLLREKSTGPWIISVEKLTVNDLRELKVLKESDPDRFSMISGIIVLIDTAETAHPVLTLKAYLGTPTVVVELSQKQRDSLLRKSKSVAFYTDPGTERFLIDPEELVIENIALRKERDEMHRVVDGILSHDIAKTLDGKVIALRGNVSHLEQVPMLLNADVQGKGVGLARTEDLLQDFKKEIIAWSSYTPEEKKNSPLTKKLILMLAKVAEHNNDVGTAESFPVRFRLPSISQDKLDKINGIVENEGLYEFDLLEKYPQRLVFPFLEAIVLALDYVRVTYGDEALQCEMSAPLMFEPRHVEKLNSWIEATYKQVKSHKGTVLHKGIMYESCLSREEKQALLDAMTLYGFSVINGGTNDLSLDWYMHMLGVTGLARDISVPKDLDLNPLFLADLKELKDLVALHNRTCPAKIQLAIDGDMATERPALTAFFVDDMSVLPDKLATIRTVLKSVSLVEHVEPLVNAIMATDKKDIEGMLEHARSVYGKFLKSLSPKIKAYRKKHATIPADIIRELKRRVGQGDVEIDRLQHEIVTSQEYIKELEDRLNGKPAQPPVFLLDSALEQYGKKQTKDKNSDPKIKNPKDKK